MLSIGAAIYVVNVRVTRQAESALQREIVATGTLVDQLRTTRTETFTTMARLIGDIPKLKAAVDTNDPPTVQDDRRGLSSGPAQLEPAARHEQIGRRAGDGRRLAARGATSSPASRRFATRWPATKA